VRCAAVLDVDERRAGTEPEDLVGDHLGALEQRLACRTAEVGRQHDVGVSQQPMASGLAGVNDVERGAGEVP
jgi:hypothetical protein